MWKAQLTLKAEVKSLGQSIRPSQFITTYGPGAILEGPNGPRIINNISLSGILNFKNIDQLEIVDQRLSESLLNGAGILRLPTNAELHLAESKPVYETKQFPGWSLCIKNHHNKLYNYSRNNRGCPDCPRPASSYEGWLKSRREAIRFVMACPNGHLDDVNWSRLVKHKRPQCYPDYLLWIGGGGALKNVKILCPNCKGEFNLGQAYAMEHECTGRLPEAGTEQNGCDQKAKIMQRGASNIRVAEIVSSLTIPKRDTRLHQLLAHSAIFGVVISSNITTKNELMEKLKALVTRKRLPDGMYEEINRYDDEMIVRAVADVCEPTNIDNELDYRVTEFDALQIASTRGAPIQVSSTPGAPPQFEVNRQDVRAFVGPRGHKLRITPVSRLRVVMVQTGYKRLDVVNGQAVPTAHHDGVKEWYPGIETFGEGVFIDLAPENDQGPLNHFEMNGADYNNWLNAFQNSEEYGLNSAVVENYQTHPVFVWWHTLSHRLINSLSIDSGYSSASIRERVFVKIEKNNPNVARGGVLLYTTQPGGDGTLGGLIGLVPEFNKVLHRVFRDVDTCSNDPLCGEEVFGPKRLNGAACYVCQFASETSCEHRNMLLDRNLLLNNLP
ncbi:DrmB family protein [Paenibacillus sp. MBLB4367]|uniref:DrmB family protein n=1 Tax=Paenibacillus sp. MBLB4367 TaxID=3384767 RepID=UPI00390834D0